MFTHATAIKLYHTDAAGRLFFGHVFFLAHDAFEAFAARAGLGVDRLLAGAAYLLPVVHAEADFARPAGAGDGVTVCMTCERVGARCFTLAYRFVDGEGREVCRARIVHASVDRATGAAIPVPEEVRAALEALGS